MITGNSTTQSDANTYRSRPDDRQCRGAFPDAGRAAKRACSGSSSPVLRDTQRFWQQRSGEAVSEEDARAAIANVAAFFDLLAQWDAESENDTAFSVEVTDEER